MKARAMSFRLSSAWRMLLVGLLAIALVALAAGSARLSLGVPPVFDEASHAGIEPADNGVVVAPSERYVPTDWDRIFRGRFDGILGDDPRLLRFVNRYV